MMPFVDGCRHGRSRNNKLMLWSVMLLGATYAVFSRFEPYNQRPISVVKLTTAKEQTVIDEVRTSLGGTQGQLEKEDAKAITIKAKQEPKNREPEVAAGSKSWAARTNKKYISLEHKGLKTFVTVDNNASLSVHGGLLTPLKERGFEVIPSERGKDGVLLRSFKNGKLVGLVPPKLEPAWAFIADGDSEGDNFVFKLEEGTYVYNKGLQAYMTVVDKNPDSLRGHGNNPKKGLPATREIEASFIFHWFDEAELQQNMKTIEEVQGMDEEQVIRKIQELPKSQEKRVISYGLYGSRTKYTNGAIRNKDLLDTYFPGWTIRFYVDETVPPSVIKQLEGNGTELIKIENSNGSIAGMFWRFLVADDSTVDRYIVRDSDSRLNARDRLAVEEWIASNKSIHSIRDHPNHCRPLNGGLWGGAKGAVKDMQGLVRKWSNKEDYGADLTFLNSVLWPMIDKGDQISHDAYCCKQYPNAKPFPTKRPDNYLHVGQVFDEDDKPRMDDIDQFIRNKDIPHACRKMPTWRYG